MSDTRVKQHPTLGILVCTDGHVMVPATRGHKAHWTYGNKSSTGYFRIRANNRLYFVHRLVAETFLQNPCNFPTVDHLNRTRTDNRVENLRWASYSMQNDNTVSVDRSVDKYGVRCCEDKLAYERKRRKFLRISDPSYLAREQKKAREYKKQRYKTDAEYRTKLIEQSRIYHSKKRENVCLH